VREVLSDLDTPLSVYLKLADGPHTYLFESVEGGERFGRIRSSACPARRVYAFAGNTFFADRAWASSSNTARSTIPSPKSNACARSTACRRFPGLPGFTGGLVGWFGFECVEYIEPRLKTGNPKTDELGTPDILLMLSEELAVFDNLKGRLYLIVHADPREPQAWAKANRRLDELTHRLRHAGASYPETLVPARAG
jgi:anthranilate synthase component 1